MPTWRRWKGTPTSTPSLAAHNATAGTHRRNLAIVEILAQSFTISRDNLWDYCLVDRHPNNAGRDTTWWPQSRISLPISESSPMGLSRMFALRCPDRDCVKVILRIMLRIMLWIMLRIVLRIVLRTVLEMMFKCIRYPHWSITTARWSVRKINSQGWDVSYSQKHGQIMKEYLMLQKFWSFIYSINATSSTQQSVTKARRRQSQLRNERLTLISRSSLTTRLGFDET